MKCIYPARPRHCVNIFGTVHCLQQRLPTAKSKPKYASGADSCTFTGYYCGDKQITNVTDDGSVSTFTSTPFFAVAHRQSHSFLQHATDYHSFLENIAENHIISQECTTDNYIFPRQHYLSTSIELVVTCFLGPIAIFNFPVFYTSAAENVWLVQFITRL